MATEQLFYPETVFFSQAKTKEEMFETVGKELLDQDLVTEDFCEKVIEREQNYPTGMDLSPINPDYEDIAIPHTETDYVKTTRIVPIKFEQPVTFHNMIIPDDTVDARMAFLILNQDPEAQVNILAQIMDFINRLSADEVQTLFTMKDTDQLYQFLSEKF
ncbi:MAG: PTS sugar transporter subunit IIA [Aerococcus sp.]|nr:PTS sugar transporter subunit IIA [Aerococcus sp.]